MEYEIEVRLFATLRNNRFKKDKMSFKEMVTSEHIIDLLNIPYEDIAILLINGHNGEFHTKLKDGDTISVFPPVGGG